jgi:hypothetical protein
MYSFVDDLTPLSSIHLDVTVTPGRWDTSARPIGILTMPVKDIALAERVEVA